MLTKFQINNLKGFCEVGILPESVARVAAIAGSHSQNMPVLLANIPSTILPRERAYFVVFGGKKNENESTKRNTAEVALCVPSIRVVWITLRRKSSSRKVDNIMRSRKCALAEGENRWKMTTSKLGNAFSYVFCMRGRCAAKRRSAVAATLAADCGSGDPASEAAGTRWPISMFVVLS
ncbi:hypothetical protein TNCV_2727771 [Trichonephila clavipes]|nr:hypothetical protein TNCV_2727771 [Trichonephila clavipes]